MPDIFQTITGGFFDSVNKDRLYTANQMNMPYKRVISDGVFPNKNGGPSGDFQVAAVSGMVVSVATGNAMIGGKWAESDEQINVTIAGNTSAYTRIDSIMIRADVSANVRAVGIVYKQGTESATPTAPALETGGRVTEIRLADITVSPAAVSITDANIIDQRGTADCPWVAGVIPPTQAQVGTAVDEYLTENPGIFIVDDSFSGTSTRAVQNKVVKAAVDNINNTTKVFNRSAAVFETAKSYLDAAYDPEGRLAYEEGVGLFQAETENGSGIKCISCSQFVQACLSGISYDFSRYVRSTNEKTAWGFVSGNYGSASTAYGDYLTAEEMAAFFQARGQLRTLSKTSPQVKAGDLLLSSNAGGFYHCAFCTGVTPTRIYFLNASDRGSANPEGTPRICDGAEAGVFIRYLAWDSQYCPTHYVSIQDIITDAIPIDVHKVAEDKEAAAGTYSGTSAYIKSVPGTYDRGLYTFKIEDDGTGDSNYYLRVSYYKADGTVPDASEEATYRENVEFIKNQNTFKSIFYAQLGIRQIDVRCSGGTKYGFKEFSMYDNAINF